MPNSATIGTRELDKSRKKYVGDVKRLKALKAMEDVMINTFGEIKTNPQKSETTPPDDYRARMMAAPIKIVSTAECYTMEAKYPDYFINTLRVKDSKQHFGNPFSYAGYEGTIKTESVDEAVNNFIEWLCNAEDGEFNGVEPERRAWILQQILENKVQNKTLLYYTETAKDGSGKFSHNHPSHAHILARLFGNVHVGKLPPLGVYRVLEVDPDTLDKIPEEYHNTNITNDDYKFDEGFKHPTNTVSFTDYGGDAIICTSEE